MMEGLLSEEEINALFSSNEATAEEETTSEASSNLLTAEEKDAIGEISNISMGTSATTLASLVGMKVEISTPVVSIIDWDTLAHTYDKPCVFIQISYKEGLHGNNILILKEHDVKVIANLMMGENSGGDDSALTDMHLSAIGEAMNQMMGSASTSISSMLETRVDISPPIASLVDINEIGERSEIAEFLNGMFVKVSFKMLIGDLVDSELMQLYPLEFARSLYSKFIHDESTAVSEPPKEAPKPVTQQKPTPQQTGQPMGIPNGMQQSAQMAMPYSMPVMQDVNIAPAQFQPFMAVQSPLLQQENIDLLLDVPLEVTVELGRTSKSIKEILDFAPGTIVELNRLAGEPIDILVNGKYVAKGEVVVIEEAFGIRITDVIK